MADGAGVLDRGRPGCGRTRRRLTVLRPLSHEYCGDEPGVQHDDRRLRQHRALSGPGGGILGDRGEAERCFAAALEMDRRMGSVVHTGETLAYHAAFAAATGRSALAQHLVAQARQVAEPMGHVRVLRLLNTIARHGGPTG